MSDIAAKLEKEFNAEGRELSLTHTCIDSFVHDIAILLTFDYEYPNYSREDYLGFVEQIEQELFNIFTELKVENKEEKIAEFMDALPVIRRSLNTSVDAIFQDVLGRLSRHGLEGYPVASTIRVAIVKQGSDTATELTRGKDWSYDASQNTITFSYTNGESTDKIAISYVLWQKTEG